jgi:hypothetical protein
MCVYIYTYIYIHTWYIYIYIYIYTHVDIASRSAPLTPSEKFWVRTSIKKSAYSLWEMISVVYRYRSPKKLSRYSDCWGWWTGLWFPAGRGVYILTCHYVHVAYGTYLASCSVDKRQNLRNLKWPVPETESAPPSSLKVENSINPFACVTWCLSKRRSYVTFKMHTHTLHTYTRARTHTHTHIPISLYI